MFLTKKTYVKRWDHMSPENQYQVTVTKGEKPVPEIDPNRISNVIEEIGYWRKANAIHKWFVDNVQGGEDNCQESYVEPQQLEELLGIVNKILAVSVLVPGKVYAGTTFSNGVRTETYEDGRVIENSKIAEELLPTTSGFFFGGTNYDEWYIQDLEHTKKILEDALKDKSGDFYYHASW